MNKQDCIKQLQDKAGHVFTRSNMKKTGVALVICAVLAGGGAWGWHQHKAAEHVRVTQARSALVEGAAAKRNIALLDEGQIRAITADTMGMDVSQIRFSKVVLQDQEREEEQPDGKDKKREKRDHKRMKRDAVTGATTSNGPKTDNPGTDGEAPAGEEQSRMMEPAKQMDSRENAFRPVYDISCQANGVKYKFSVDAVNGQVLRSHAG